MACAALYTSQIFAATVLNDVIAVVANAPVTTVDLAHEIERARIEAGLSTDDLLRSLREQRERYRREKYGDTT